MAAMKAVKKAAKKGPPAPDGTVSRSSHWRTLNNHPRSRRARQRVARENRKTKQEARRRTPEERGQHRLCYRCEKRSDKCAAKGCIPFEYKVVPAAYAELKTFLGQLDAMRNSRRFDSDCIDVSLVGGFAKQCLVQGNTKMAVFTCCLAGHYGNNLQTWSRLLEARDGDHVDWDTLEQKVLDCKDLFAKTKASYGLHSRNCMPGRGFPKAASDATHAVSEVRGLRNMYSSQHFVAVCTQIQRGIKSFADYKVVFEHMEKLGDDSPGCLGGYHMKMAMDHMQYSGMLPPRWVMRWPVAPKSGTALGLHRLFGTETNNPQALQTMLVELYVRLRRDRALKSKDTLGSIGAVLCWQKRTDTETAAGVSRYDYTTDTSELELATLRRLHIAVPGAASA